MSEKKPSEAVPATVPVPAPTLALGLVSSGAIDAAVALGPNGVEVLERLHAIAKEERADRARGQFAAAMAVLRRELPEIRKTVEGQHGATRKGTRTTGMYAPLDTITRVLNPLLAKHGFSYRYDRVVQDGTPYVLCIVTHEGGHSETSRFPAPADNGPGRTAIQGIASGESYARRYALTAAFAITTADPDDDGADAERITEEQAASLQSLIEEVKADAPRFRSAFGIERLADLRASDLPRATRMLEKKREQAAARKEPR